MERSSAASRLLLATVGFEEVRPLDDDARIFTILLIVGGVGAALYSFAAMAEFLVAGHLAEILGRRSMERNLAALHDHVIVCGAGRLGQTVIEELVRSQAWEISPRATCASRWSPSVATPSHCS